MLSAGIRRGLIHGGKLKRKIIRLGVAGTLAALAVSAVGIPAQAADVQPAKPGISTEATAAQPAAGVAVVEGLTEVGRMLIAGFTGPVGGGSDAPKYQWMRNGVPISFWTFTKYGLIVTAVTITLCIPYLWLRYFA